MTNDDSMEIVKDERADDVEEEQQVTIPKILPVLPLPDTVVFPYMIVPLFVNREQSVQAVDQSLAENRMILVVSQKEPEIDEPEPGDLYPVGTVALIMRMLKLPMAVCAFWSRDLPVQRLNICRKQYRSLKPASSPNSKRARNPMRWNWKLSCEA